MTWTERSEADPMDAAVRAIRGVHPWVSEERARDLLGDADAKPGPLATPLERLLFVGAQLDFLWGTDPSTDTPRGIFGGVEP